MPTCSKCGSMVAEGVKFCGSCGSPMEAAGATPGGAGGQPPMPVPATGNDQGGLTPNVAALLTYLPICLIGLVCAILFGFVLDPYRKNRFIRFHAWQSLAVHGVFVVLGIGWTIVSMMLTAIIHFLGILTIPISLLMCLAGLLLGVVLMLKAYGNQTFKLPIIGDWAEKQAGTGD